ncbi:G2-specific serine/threonine protein kinase [Puccinia graminis f. sp. tritici]|uniref:non-specific serine/threonine protein kinase n=1 Tax=Puccinia graminis f. sp. tritici TaxID=56615 RepID=A0A5B0MM17_PUCGR|nr:G2-specific serine/threonine protein kinase [Puccinia graminis f. sp. tritici]
MERMVTKATFVPENFTRKPVKMERFIRPMGLRVKKANITHPELQATFQLPIIGVKKNPQSPMYTQLGVLTKGTVIEVNVSELGLVTTGGKVVWAKYAQVTNNPELDGCVNGNQQQPLTHSDNNNNNNNNNNCLSCQHSLLHEEQHYHSNPWQHKQLITQTTNNHHHHPTQTTPLTNNNNNNNNNRPLSQTQTTIQSMDTQFEPLDIIGTGSFGIIRKVKRTSDGLILARKELNYGRMDERDLRQLGEEVNILQNLRGNEHIVKYFERYVDKQNFMLYILMEYCSQGDLAGVISRCRRDQVHLSEDTIWSYLAQITTALADCHSSEVSEEGGKKKPIILHRDIKPENVFLNHFGLVKLGDFGLSKAMEMAAFTNTYVGTPYYMSPELINGQQYDVKSDIWALGCLIYELCAWHPPFHQAQTQPELAKLIREGKIPNLPRGYSSQLTALIKSMLRQDPKLRPDAKTILMVEQVKHQTRVLEVHRYARELTKKQSELEEREKALEERENKLKSRESKFQREKEYFKTQQENHLVLQQEFQAKFQNAMEVIEHANRIERALQDENQALDTPETDHLTLAEGSDSEIIAETKPRRIPLAERRLSLNPPGFTSPNEPSVLGSTPQSVSSDPKPFRQVKSSKSMASLKSTYSLLSRLKSNDDTESISPSEDGGSSIRKMATDKKGSSGTTPGNPSGPRSRRLSRRSESANGLLVGPSSNPISSQLMTNRRPTSTIGSVSTPGGSTNSTNSGEPFAGEPSGGTGKTGPAEHLHPASGPAPPSNHNVTPSAVHRSPRYNHSDPDSLPSPFLKKKASTSTLVSNFLRPTNNSATAPGSPRKPAGPARTCSVDTVGLGMKRIPSMLQHIRSSHAPAPPVATRPSQIVNGAASKRPNSAANHPNSSNPSKPSLTSRFLSHNRDDSSHKKSAASHTAGSSASSAPVIGVSSNHLGSKRKDKARPWTTP